MTAAVDGMQQQLTSRTAAAPRRVQLIIFNVCVLLVVAWQQRHAWTCFSAGGGMTTAAHAQLTQCSVAPEDGYQTPAAADLQAVYSPWSRTFKAATATSTGSLTLFSAPAMGIATFTHQLLSTVHRLSLQLSQPQDWVVVAYSDQSTSATTGNLRVLTCQEEFQCSSAISDIPLVQTGLVEDVDMKLTSNGDHPQIAYVESDSVKIAVCSAFPAAIGSCPSALMINVGTQLGGTIDPVISLALGGGGRQYVAYTVSGATNGIYLCVCDTPACLSSSNRQLAINTNNGFGHPYTTINGFGNAEVAYYAAGTTAYINVAICSNVECSSSTVSQFYQATGVFRSIVMHTYGDQHAVIFNHVFKQISVVCDDLPCVPPGQTGTEYRLTYMGNTSDIGPGQYHADAAFGPSGSATFFQSSGTVHVTEMICNGASTSSRRSGRGGAKLLAVIVLVVIAGWASL